MNTANSVTTAGNAGLLTPIVTDAQVQSAVDAAAQAAIPAAVASVTYSVDPNTRHLVRTRTDAQGNATTSDIGLVGGSKFWGGYANLAAFPKASDGVLSGDYAFNQNNSSLYGWQSGGWVNLGSLAGTTVVPSFVFSVSSLPSGSQPTQNVTQSGSTVNVALGIPVGATGPAPTIGIGSVASISFDAKPYIVNVGTAAAPVWNIGIPAGIPGVVSATAPMLYDGATKTVSIDKTYFVTPAQMSAAITAAAYTPLVTAPITYSGGKIGFDSTGFVTSSALTTALAPYALSSALSGYITTSSLTTTLQGYVTAGTLASYPTTAAMNAAIAAAAPSATAPLAYNPTTRVFSIPASTTTADGYMSAAQATDLASLKSAKTLYLLNQTFNVPLLALGGSYTQSYTVTGAQVGMGVTVNPRAASQYGPMLYAYVSAANTVTVAINALVALGANNLALDIHVFPNPA
jgi:hypothetical protein